MIRYFCTVHSRAGTWADLGYAYYLALRQLATVRVIPGRIVAGPQAPTELIDLVDAVGGDGRWIAHAEAFVIPVEGDVVNVVCGDGASLAHHFTVGMKNVAITAVMVGEPTEAQVTALKRYDLVLCPTREDVDALDDRGVRAVLAPPEPDALGRAMKEMIDACLSGSLTRRGGGM